MKRIIYDGYRVSVCPDCRLPVQVRQSPAATYLACPGCPNRWVLDDDPSALTIRPTATSSPFPPFIPSHDLEESCNAS